MNYTQRTHTNNLNDAVALKPIIQILNMYNYTTPVMQNVIAMDFVDSYRINQKQRISPTEWLYFRVSIYSPLFKYRTYDSSLIRNRLNVRVLPALAHSRQCANCLRIRTEHHRLSQRRWTRLNIEQKYTTFMLHRKKCILSESPRSKQEWIAHYYSQQSTDKISFVINGM